MATYQALDALETLGAREAVLSPRKPVALEDAARSLPDLKVYSIQIEAHGQGSPAEAVDAGPGPADPPLGGQERPAGMDRAGPGDRRRRRGCRYGSSSPTKNTAPGSAFRAWARTATRATSSRRPAATSARRWRSKGWSPGPSSATRRLAPLRRRAGGSSGSSARTRSWSGSSSTTRSSAAAMRRSARSTSATPTSPTPSRSWAATGGRSPSSPCRTHTVAEPWWFADMTDGLPHPLPGPRPDLGRLARGAPRRTGSSPSAATR